MFFKDKLARIRSECASFIEDILAKSKGNPQMIGKCLNGILEFLKDKLSTDKHLLMTPPSNPGN